MEMGGNNSKGSSVSPTLEEIQEYKRSYQLMKETITTNNSATRLLTSENVQLNKMLEEEQKEKEELENQRELESKSIRCDSGMQEMLSLFEELPKFKNKIEQAKAHLLNNEHDREIERLKQENVVLYTRLKGSASNRQISIEKSRELRELEKQLKTETNEFEHKLSINLDEIKRKMDEASTTFANRMERAVSELQTVLATSEKRFKSIKEQSRKPEDSVLYEKIKNILLQQKNSLLKQTLDLNIRQPGPLELHFLTAFNNSAAAPNMKNIQAEKPININNLNKETNKEVGKFEGDNQNKIMIFYAPEDCDDKLKAQSILRHLTNLSLSKIEVYRMGKIGEKPRPMVVTLENVTYVNEILQKRFSLKDTEFKGIKIVKYNKEHENKQDADKNLSKNIQANKTNPLCDDPFADEGEEVKPVDDKPHKIVLFYVAEDGNDHKKAVSILKKLTRLPLINIDVGRIGNKSDVKIRPMIISFDSQQYVNDALQNRYSLKDTTFKGIKVVKYKKQTQQNTTKNIGDTFPF